VLSIDFSKVVALMLYAAGVFAAAALSGGF